MNDSRYVSAAFLKLPSAQLFSGKQDFSSTSFSSQKLGGGEEGLTFYDLGCKNSREQRTRTREEQEQIPEPPGMTGERRKEQKRRKPEVKWDSSNFRAHLWEEAQRVRPKSYLGGIVVSRWSCRERARGREGAAACLDQPAVSGQSKSLPACLPAAPVRMPSLPTTGRLSGTKTALTRAASPSVTHGRPASTLGSGTPEI